MIMFMNPYPDSSLEVNFPLPIKEYVYHKEHAPKPSTVYERPMTRRKPEIHTKHVKEVRQFRIGMM